MAASTATAEVQIINADVVEGLRSLPAASVQTCITSPPYYGLRSYGIPPRRWSDGSECVLGDEATLDLYITHLVEVFREVRRVLHPSGTLWLNLGDCYAGGGKHVERKEIYDIPLDGKPARPRQRNLSGKDLLLIPARAALALQGDGWILRTDIIWAKAVSFLKAWSGSVMPESTRDRPIWSHEHVFLLAKEERYFYDIDGAREEYADSTRREAGRLYMGRGRKDYAAAHAQDPSDTKRRVLDSVARGSGRNLRNVWIIPKQNFPGMHFATFPEKLVEPMIRLATSEKGQCPVCGAPVRRRVVREPVPERVRLAFEEAREQTAAETGREDGHTSKRPNYRRVVIATQWEAGCGCGIDHAVEATVPQTVLDIFNGSGRTGIVAHRLGRKYIGIDVNPEYCEMARTAIMGGTDVVCGIEGRASGSSSGSEGHRGSGEAGAGVAGLPPDRAEPI